MFLKKCEEHKYVCPGCGYERVFITDVKFKAPKKCKKCKAPYKEKKDGS